MMGFTDQSLQTTLKELTKNEEFLIMKLDSSQHLLSVIATPIGNMSELSPRALACLNEAYVILCEDTKVTTQTFAIQITLLIIKNVSYHNFNEEIKLQEALELIRKYKNSTSKRCWLSYNIRPGYLLIQALCHEQNIGVEVINGPSAIMHALVASGCQLYFLCF